MGSPVGVSTRKGGGFYGYKIHAAVCTRTGLPLAWQVETAARNEPPYVAPLVDAVRARGYSPETVAMDMGYDNNRVYAECDERGCAPVIPLRQTPDVKRGQHGAPTCEHGALGRDDEAYDVLDRASLLTVRHLGVAQGRLRDEPDE